MRVLAITNNSCNLCMLDKAAADYEGKREAASRIYWRESDETTLLWGYTLLTMQKMRKMRKP